MKHAIAIMGIVLYGLGATANALAFEDACSSLDQWDVLDLGKQEGQVFVAEDTGCPPGYGPRTIRVAGEEILLFAKGNALGNRTFVALYRENQPVDADSDGVLMFWADYPKDIESAHNVKEKRAHVWLQMDGTEPMECAYLTPDGEQETLAECEDAGVLTGDWNKTNWIWQKVQVEGDRVRAKFWPANEPEPAEWALEGTYGGERGKRFGIRVASGGVSLAYFASDAQDIPITPPDAWLHFGLEKALQACHLPVTLFTNAAKASEESFNVTVKSGDAVVGEGVFDAAIPAGTNETPVLLWAGDTEPPFDGAKIRMTQEPSTGMCTVDVRSKSGAYAASRTFEIAPMAELQAKIDGLRAVAEPLAAALAQTQDRSDKTTILKATCRAARAHIDRATALFRAGDAGEADHTLRFAAEALAEFQGYRGEWLHAVAPDFQMPDVTYDPADRRRVPESKDGKFADVYSMAYLVRFGMPKLSADSFSMGHGYEVEIPWSVEGATPGRDFAFQYVVESPMGTRVVAQSDAAPEVPASQWKPGQTYLHKIRLDVIPEDPSSKREFLSQPPVLDEYHRILVTVTDPKTGANLLLGNEPGPHNVRMGSKFLVADVYVSSAPLEIRAFTPAASEVLAPRNDTVSIGHVGEGAAWEGGLLFTATAETGRILFQQAQPVNVAPGSSHDAAFAWTPTVAGRVTLRVCLMKDGTAVTEAKRGIHIQTPEGCAIAVEKNNHVEQDGERFFTPIVIEAGKGPLSTVIRAKGRVVGKGESAAAALTVQAEPWFGYYDVTVDAGTFQFERRLIATVVETKDWDLLLNGEPFLVKGVNVHGLASQSPAYTATMMRTMRELGFNMWRTDYPAMWQVDLAYELNTAYTVLAPFSCTSTAGVFARAEGPYMTTARELSRIFIQRYRDAAGVLFWNSCNEIKGETADFLESLYPLYKEMDVYNRPVHYANLAGQNYWQGQDIMGMNWYFWKGKRATDRQPNMLVNIRAAQEHNIPSFFNEFNSWYGAIPSTGVEAFRDMYVWGIEQGMVGGFQYQCTNSDRHPGIMDDNCNTHKLYDDAIVDALADAKVLFKECAGGKLTVQIINKRRFTLRQVSLDLSASGTAIEPVQLADMKPGETREVSVELPAGAVGPTLTVAGDLRFVTHFGFECKVPVNLLVNVK